MRRTQPKDTTKCQCSVSGRGLPWQCPPGTPCVPQLWLSLFHSCYGNLPQLVNKRIHVATLKTKQKKNKKKAYKWCQQWRAGLKWHLLELLRQWDSRYRAQRKTLSKNLRINKLINFKKEWETVCSSWYSAPESIPRTTPSRENKNKNQSGYGLTVLTEVPTCEL